MPPASNKKRSLYFDENDDGEDDGNNQVNSRQKRTLVTGNRQLVRDDGTSPDQQAFRSLMQRSAATCFEYLNKLHKDVVAAIEIPQSLYDGMNDPRLLKLRAAASNYLLNAEQINYQFGPMRHDAPNVAVTYGNNDMHQLGLYSDDPRAVYRPTVVTALRGKGIRIRQVAAGGTHSLCVTDTGSVYSWGSSDDGVLGRPAKGNEKENWAEGEARPQEVKGFATVDGKINEDDTIVAVSAGAAHSLFLTYKGNVYQCGVYKDMDSGLFSDPDGPNGKIKGCNESPVHMFQIPQKVIRIEAGGSHNAVILHDRTLLTWGFGNCGELARSADMTKPDPRTGKYDIKRPFFYDMDTGRVREDVVREHFLTPRPPRWAGKDPFPRKQVLRVACGDFHMLVTARDGATGEGPARVYAAGLNQYGQLGLGDQEERHELTPIKQLDPANPTYVAAGLHHSLVLSLSGTQLFAFGRSDYGQLGLGPQVDHSMGAFQSTPQVVAFPVEEPVQLIQIECGENHSLAVTSDHLLYSWGFAEFGATGNLSDEDILEPRLVKPRNTGLKKKNETGRVMQVSGGSQHSAMVVNRYLPRSDS